MKSEVETKSMFNTVVEKARAFPSWIPCLCLCIWGLLLRIFAAGKVFPAQGDASHFVQHGKAYCAMGMDAISGYWSILPQFLTAWSVKLGWMPQCVLQATTVGFGVLLVAGVYALAMELTGKRTIAFVAGLLIATNPVLTASATSGLSETPHMALAIWALVLAFAGARKGRVWLFALAGAVASVDMYYRPYDLFLYLAGAAPFILWRMRKNTWRRNAGMMAAGILVGAACSGPFFAITAMKSAGSAGSSKLVNLAFRKHGLDAKAMYATKGLNGDETPLSQEIRELQEKGALGYMWANRGGMIRDYVQNIAKGIRHLNDHVFTGMFRVGLFWFVLASMLFALALWKDGQGGVALCALLPMGVILGMLSLGFVHPRWIMQLLPFYVLLAGGGFAWLAERLSGRRTQWLLWGCLLALGVLNGRWAVKRLDDEWKDKNLFAVANRLHNHVEEREILMSFQPELPALFYRTNTLAWMAIPYGSVEEVFEWADIQKVDCLVLHDGIFPHFPIHEIENHPERIPPPWHEIDHMAFEQETRFGLEQDEYRVFRKEGNIQ